MSVATGAEGYCKCTEGRGLVLGRNIRNGGRLGEGNAKAANRRKRKGGAPVGIKWRARETLEATLSGAVSSVELTVHGRRGVGGRWRGACDRREQAESRPS